MSEKVSNSVQQNFFFNLNVESGNFFFLFFGALKLYEKKLF